MSDTGFIYDIGSVNTTVEDADTPSTKVLHKLGLGCDLETLQSASLAARVREYLYYSHA